MGGNYPFAGCRTFRKDRGADCIDGKANGKCMDSTCIRFGLFVRGASGPAAADGEDFVETDWWKSRSWNDC